MVSVLMFHRTASLTQYRELASKYVRVHGAIYSLHHSYRDARICYMRALVGREVCRLDADGLTELAVLPVIPLNQTFSQWWTWCWSSWDEDDNLPVPTVNPLQ